MSLVSKAFSDIVTFSRSSNATRIGPTGRVEYAPHNLLLRSQEFDNASWTKTWATISANSVAAPDGTVTADKLAETTANSAHQAYQSLTLTAQPYTFSFYAKAAERTWVSIYFDPAFSAAYVNLANGTVGTVPAGYSITVTSVGNGWYRIATTRTATAATWYMVIETALGDGQRSYAGTAGSGIYIWGAQLSVGPYPLDYTPTTSAAVYGPRFDYDPVTLAARGLLVEEQRTNLLTYSEQFDNAAWTPASVTVNANSTVAPNGTLSADTLIATTASSDHDLYPSVSLTAASYTLSVYAKYAGANLALSAASGVTTWAGCIFDLQNGVAKTPQGSGLTCTAAIQSVGNGWYRCSITYTATATSWYQIFSTTNNVNATMGNYGFISYAGDGTSGIYLWGAQLEAGSFATSYIPTLASSVTRSADVASVDTLSPWMNQTEGTLFAEGSFIAPTSSSSKGIATLVDNSSGNESISIFGISSSNVKQEVLVGGASQASFTLGYSTAIKAATAYKANDTNAAVNGVAGTTDTSCSIPTVAKLQLGGIYNGTSFQMNGWLSRVAFFPRRLTNAELQALTA